MMGQTHPEISGRRILVVEDERLLALDLQDILQGWGCEVIGPAASTVAALALIEGNPPEAAILDVHLRGETSEPVADALLAQGRPFLVLTAYQRRDLPGVLGDAPLLRKPVDEKKLQQELASLFAAA
jgi:CheY-like chemotaxis protein